MNSKERIHQTFKHRMPDRVPLDFGGLSCTSMHVLLIDKLRDLFGLPKHPVKVLEPFTMIGEFEDDLRGLLHIDTCNITAPGTVYGLTKTDWKPWTFHHTEVLVPGNFNITEAGKGGYYLFSQGDTTCEPSGYMPAGGYYFDALPRPLNQNLEECNIQENKADYILWEKEKYDFYLKQVQKYKDSGKFLIIAGLGTNLGDPIEVLKPASKERPRGIRTFENWMMALSIDPDSIQEVFEYQTDIAIQNFSNFPQEIVKSVDMAYVCGSDIGTQAGYLFSPKVIREVYMPYYKKINDWLHNNFGWKTIKHSCGANWDMLPIFIEAGFDAFTPVQTSAAGMDPKKLKETYGKDIVFWGGGVDVQKTLPFGTSMEVYNQVLDRLEIFSKDGGYVFNAIHNLQPGIPIKNLEAMFKAFYKFNGM